MQMSDRCFRVNGFRVWVAGGFKGSAGTWGMRTPRRWTPAFRGRRRPCGSGRYCSGTAPKKLPLSAITPSSNGARPPPSFFYVMSISNVEFAFGGCQFALPTSSTACRCQISNFPSGAVSSLSPFLLRHAKVTSAVCRCQIALPPSSFAACQCENRRWGLSVCPLRFFCGMLMLTSPLSPFNFRGREFCYPCEGLMVDSSSESSTVSFCL